MMENYSVITFRAFSRGSYKKKLKENDPNSLVLPPTNTVSAGSPSIPVHGSLNHYLFTSCLGCNHDRGTCVF